MIETTELATTLNNVPATVMAQRFTETQIAESSIHNAQSLPKLSSEQKHFMPLNVEYWTPKNEGEEKLVYIMGIAPHEIADMETGELKTLDCVQMVEQQGESLVRIVSASKVLVGNVADAIKRGEIIPASTLTPVSIKFLGQKKNKSNARLSNRWQVVPIVIKEPI